ncbi:DUF2786 domain-containing protein [Corynebacterium sphenisci]|uniref:DUF2786 domain-containing protein n=1 Tax=Corynebacterium sphenisci TaxID=191493 RepID=UPI0009532311|nr:DUF2786 domain-containing protein [Corynebacterium sphenisci]
MADRDRIRARIRGLLAQAADRAGTPEGDAFEERAYQLLARYGLDPGDLAGAGPRRAPVVEHGRLTGRYLHQQAALLAAVAEGLHCTVVRSGAAGGVMDYHLAGAPRHLERVRLLFPMLNAAMAAGAARARPAPGERLGTAQVRRSWMLGFAAGVHRRLTAAEGAAAADAPGAGLVLLDDRRRAEAALAERFPGIRRTRATGALSRAALAEGRRAAARADLGQTRLRPRPALPG